jgi:hypothetical protein
LGVIQTGSGMLADFQPYLKGGRLSEHAHMVSFPVFKSFC